LVPLFSKSGEFFAKLFFKKAEKGRYPFFDKKIKKFLSLLPCYAIIAVYKTAKKIIFVRRFDKWILP
jgi:hypothetical protein